MKEGFIDDIQTKTLENDDYRRVLYTANYSQLVLMSIEPGDDIGEEVHGLDQFIRIEQGEGKAILNQDQEHELSAGSAVVIPSGTAHNVVSTGDEPLKLYSIYAPPEHEDGTVHEDKADETDEHFHGHTTE
jgi:mannose-6-phosphate isomerase-like protein (cupin superfamily)